MARSPHRLSFAERKPPMVPLDEVFATYIDHHKALGRSRNTWLRYEASHRLLLRFLADRAITPTTASLTTPIMRDFARWLQDTPLERPCRGSTTRSVYGVRGTLKDLRSVCHWLIDEELLAAMPKIPVPKLPDRLFPILSQEELERVWSSRYLSGRSSLAVRNRALIGLMLDTGLRRGEVASLTLEMIDLSDCLLTVTGKGRKQRRVPFSSSVKVLLTEWLSLRGSDEGPLFWLQPSGIRQVFRGIKQDVGLARFHPHMLRHQAATTLVRHNVDLESVRRILGHSDIATTVKYLSMSDDDLRAKHAAASPFDALLRQTQPSPTPRRRRLSLAD